MEEKLQRFKKQFAEETRERIRTINNLALALELSPGRTEIVEQLKREMHTIKGGSRILGLKAISRLAHFFEGFFQQVITGRAFFQPETLNPLLSALDLMQELLEGDETPAASERVEVFVSGALPEAPPPASGTPGQDELRKALVERMSRRPAAPPGLPEPEESACEPVPASHLRNLDAGEPAPFPQEPARSAPAGVASTPDDRKMVFARSFRIDSDLIDSLSEGALQLKVMVSFFGIFLDQYASLARAVHISQQDLARLLANLPAGPAHDDLESFQLHLRDLAQVASDKKKYIGSRVNAFQKYFDTFYRNVEELKLIPLATIFSIYPRFVRDYAMKNGKEIKFDFQGAATRLDKRIAETINDSLIHLLRNAVDHGIEPPQERIRMGKPAAGQILLSASTHGDRVVIVIQDDGRGFDAEEIRQAAIKKKILPEADLIKSSEAEILNLVFLPGFSTAPIITDNSGRGVGLDVVQNALKNCNGGIRLQTRKSIGSQIELELPISISTTRVIHIREQEAEYAIPADLVKEVRPIRLSDLTRRDPIYYLIENGRSVPTARLAAILGDAAIDPAPTRDQKILLLLQAGQDRFGLLVDQTLDEENAIINRKDPFIRNLSYLSGISVNIYGTPFLVLDGHFLARFFQSPHARSAIKAAAKTSPSRKVILLVEDSVVTREMEKVILESAGFQVVEAVNGLAGLEKLAAHHIDCVVTDVEMPVMDGFAMTDQIRRLQTHRDIPIIIVTTRESREDKIRGIQVGANAYITKKDFDQMQLVETVNRLV